MTDSTSTMFGRSGADWLSHAIRHNPEGLLVLGAGIALLLRKGGAKVAAGATMSAPEQTLQARTGMASNAFDGGVQETRNLVGAGVQQVRAAVNSGVQQAREMVSGGVQQAREALNSGVQQASDTLRSSLDTASDYAQRTRGTISEQSAQLKDQSTTMLNQSSDFMRNQPLALAALGVGVGMALAAVLPRTEAEEGMIGPARNRLADTARDASARVARATGVAGSELIASIAKRGFNEAGVKEMVGEVAHSFTGALGDHDRAQQRGANEENQNRDTGQVRPDGAMAAGS